LAQSLGRSLAELFSITAAAAVAAAFNTKLLLHRRHTTVFVSVYHMRVTKKSGQRASGMVDPIEMFHSS